MEMVLVLAILGLVAALALPSLRQATDRLGRDAAPYELVGLLRQARQEALVGRTTLAVRFEPCPGGARAWVEQIDTQGQAQPLHESWADPIELPALPTILAANGNPSPQATVRFGPQGVEQDWLIVFPGPSSQAPRIEIIQPSGLVRVVSEWQQRQKQLELQAIEQYWERACDRIDP